MKLHVVSQLDMLAAGASRLPVDGRYVTETTLQVLTTADAVLAIESEIKQLQAQGAPKVNVFPTEPFAPEA